MFDKKSIFINRPGFTLIELLVAISIIAVLSAVGISTYQQAQVRARDARRKSDLRSIATALEIYRQKNGVYPCTDGGVNSGWITTGQSTSWLKSNCSPGTFENLSPNYINSVPVDPISSTSTTPWINGSWGYGYYSWANSGAGNYGNCSPGTYYILVAQLENSNDSDRFAVKQNVICGIATTWAASNTFIISSP